MASRSWNRVELIGNLTRDPELRYTPTGTPVATIGIATNRVYMSEGERREEVDFHRLVAWGKLAELCQQLLKKGSRVFISGRLQYHEWETQEGAKRRDAEIVLEDMILLTPKNGMVTLGEVEESVVEPPTSVEEETSAPKQEEKVSESSKTKPAKETSKAQSGSAKSEEDMPETKMDETVESSDLPF